MIDKISLKRRSRYPGPYKYFEAKTSWDLGLSLIEYPKYLFKIYVVKVKNPYPNKGWYLFKAISGTALKLSVKAAFVIIVIKFIAPHI